MYHHSLFLCLDKWGTKRANSTSKKAQTRLPIIPILIYLVCRGFFKSHKLSEEIWSRGSSSAKIYPLITCSLQMIVWFSQEPLLKTTQIWRIYFYYYATASIQIFNYEKSFIFFSGKTQPAQIASIKNLFQLHVVSKYERYLGLPSMVGKKKLRFFNKIKLRVLSKISNWQSKMFPKCGKEVLIKDVAQAIPVYAMSVFKLPMGLCDDIQKAITRFWWNWKQNQRPIH